ncbi:DUF968 domain-containing protein [Escherichia coli]|nr:DUF968 domain-containing protein [Escherichia coli]
MTERIEFVLPYPPTVNTYWRRRGSTYFVSKVGERYRRDVALIVRQQQLKLNLSGRPAIEIIAEPPDKRRRDLDNILKASLGLRAEKIRSMYRESDIVPGEQTATSILKQRTKNLAPLPHAHQQNPPQEETVVSIAVDPESPESFMKRPKRRRWVNEKYTRWVKTQPCACCGKPADDPHHLIGHGQGGMGTKSHDIFTLPLCREHHNELHADPLAFEEKHGSQVDLIFRFLDHAFATGVLG